MLFIEKKETQSWEITILKYENNELRIMSSSFIDEHGKLTNRGIRYSNVNIDFKEFINFIYAEHKVYINENIVELWLNTNNEE